jgi:hypothetical protein
MKCLSIKQPWLNLILKGMKSIEVRTYKGDFALPVPILLHAGKTIDKEAVKMFRIIPEKTQLSAILGVAMLVEFRSYANKEMWEQDAVLHRNPLDWWDAKKIGLVLQDLWSFYRPMPYKGKLQFFDVDLPPELDVIIKEHYEVVKNESNP